MMERSRLRMVSMWFLSLLALLFAVRESWLAVMLMFCSWLCLECASAMFRKLKEGS